MKILIVDDEEIILEEACEALAGEGYECFVASDVAAAIKIFNTVPSIKLILTDLRMPGGTGLDLMRYVRGQIGDKIGFIVMSGNASPKVELADAGELPIDILKKPLDIESLIERVNSVLGVKG